MTPDVVPKSPARPALLEGLGVWVVAVALPWLLFAGPLRDGSFTAALASSALVFFALPLAVLALTRRPLHRAGLVFRPIARPVETGLTALAVVGPISGMAFPLIGWLGWSPTALPGSLVLTAAYLLALPLTAFVIRKTAHVDGPQPLWALGVLLGVVAAVGALSLAVPGRPLWVLVLVMVFFVGFGEELLFRGYLQSRLDEGLGTPFTLFGTSFGWGLPLAALAFGLSHFLSPATFGQVGTLLWTTAGGLVFGLIRQRSGSFVASGIVHGVINSVPVVIFGAMG